MGLRPPNNNIFLNLRGTSKILAQVFIFIMSQQRPRNNLECSLLISTIMFQFDWFSSIQEWIRHIDSKEQPASSQPWIIKMFWSKTLNVIVIYRYFNCVVSLRHQIDISFPLNTKWPPYALNSGTCSSNDPPETLEMHRCSRNSIHTSKHKPKERLDR